MADKLMYIPNDNTQNYNNIVFHKLHVFKRLSPLRPLGTLEEERIEPST